MVKINFNESHELRLFEDGEESNFAGFITTIVGIQWVEFEYRFIFLISEGKIIRYTIYVDIACKNIINHIHLHQLITIKKSIARIGVLDPFANDSIVHEFRFEVNHTSQVNIIPFTLSNDHFTSLPNLQIEIDSESEDELIR
ncbi:hypothetical protein KQX54_006617 [Cotesia glomerata]|uniref:Uncharacterized protein n=1 Tax=Cotesia glomerata TaxID=32391 RepID=A0AAV7IR19_COTGL|nr:hypothetical protein KQX54_006617 [Cotesia glomerata]